MSNPPTSPSATPDAQDVRETIRRGYAQVARSGGCSSHDLDLSTLTPAQESSSCCTPATKLPSGGGGCCGATKLTADQLAQKIGYSASEIQALPDGANMGLSCGNPGAIAALKPGEIVLDLGSGGGFDVFLAGPKVGPTGRVIGVDMTPEMLSKARRNLAGYRKTTGLANVEFRLGEIEHLPLPDASVDVVISNCVINLSPDKPQVWREIARVLKPGGRVAVSDMALLRPLPEAVRQMVAALVGCVAGAELVDDYRAVMAAAGLKDIRLQPKPGYVASLAQSGDPLYRQVADALPEGTTAADFITSLDITARK